MPTAYTAGLLFCKDTSIRLGPGEGRNVKGDGELVTVKNEIEFQQVPDKRN